MEVTDAPTVHKVRYKWCFVPMCTSTTCKTPDKQFVHVPDNVQRRKMWLQAARRDERKSKLSTNTVLFCCQDHFNMEEDMDNYMKFKMTGCKLRSKKNVVPHIFDCQPQRTATLVGRHVRTAAAKRCAAQHIENAIDAVQEASKSTIDIPGPAVDPDVDPHVDEDEVPMEASADESEERMESSVDTSTKPHTFDVVMSSQDAVDVKTDDITTERDIFLTAVKMEVDVKPLSPPALAFVNVKQEPSDHSDEMSSFADELSESADDVLQPVEQINVSSLVVKTELDEDVPGWEPPETEGDSLPVRVKREEKEEDTKCSLHATQAFVEVNVDSLSGCAQWELEEEHSVGHSATAVDPLMLPGIKAEQEEPSEIDPLSLSGIKEEEEERPTNRSGTMYTIKNETIEGDRLQSTVFACRMCEMTCVSQDEFNQHVVTHGGDGRLERLSHDVISRYTCNTCGKHFDRKVALSKHLSLHSVAVPPLNDSPTRLKRRKALAPNGDRFVCKSCGKAFASRSKLKSHTSSSGTCDVSRAFACNVATCKKRFDTRSSLDQHKVVHSDVQALVCDVCDFRCRRPDTLRNHKRQHPSSDLPMFPCSQCGKIFNRRNNLMRHVLTHTDVSTRTFACDVPECRYRFNSKCDLKRHMMSHSDVKKFSCDRCEYRCKKRCELNTHVRVHSVDDQFPCGECGKRFISTSKLRLHSVTHFDDRKRIFVCSFETCGKRFKSKALRKAHYNCVHTDGMQLMCDMCDFKSKRKIELVYHLRVHSLNYPEMFSCDECGKKFATIGRLRAHVSTHIIAKTFACDAEMCGKAFKTKTLLVVHKIVHSETKRYGCDLCDFRGKRLSSVAAHMRTHLTGDQLPFRCTECGKSFVSKTALKNHGLTHTDVRTFACDIGTCDKVFKTYAVLKRHKMVHSDTKEYGCDKCDYRCRRRAYLKGHNMRFHPSNSTDV